MRVVSVNVGIPKDVPYRGGSVRTGIFKRPVGQRVLVRRLNLEGDGQADLTVHGGRDKAVYAYPAEHYAFWRAELLGRELPWGVFGENLSTKGLLESGVCVGDEFRVGTALLMATQPRMPCYKLGVRFDDPRMVKRFVTNQRPGIYFSVLEEGELGPGDPVALIRRDDHRVSILDLFRLIVTDKADVELVRRALRAPALPGIWRHELAARLAGSEHH